MLYTKIFTFGSKTLKLKTLEELDSNLEKNIQFLFTNFLYELNHNSKDSTAKKFNDSQNNIPIFLSKEFIDFFEYNVDFYSHFPDQFKPFELGNEPSTGTSEVIDIRSFYLKDLKNETLVKIKDFKFDSGFLRSSYVLELLKKYLLENVIENYSVVLPNIIQAFGKFKWESRFSESEEFSQKTFQLKDASALLIQEKMIALGKDLSLLKILEPKLENIIAGEELQTIAKKYSIDFVI